MDIPTRNRVELKSYFVKNSIPTEGNFADLIDGMLNQKDDGIVKLPGNPLVIEAAGDSAGSQTVLDLYRNFDDTNAEWTISLNPSVVATASPVVASAPAPAKLAPGSAVAVAPAAAPAPASPSQRGFSINDAGGVSRLFIDQATGKVGIGTVRPAHRLDVNGTMIVRGAITPSPGNGESFGIMFPPDPFGGSGDRAWIRYHNALGGEIGTLEIGIANDGNDNISLVSSGPVNLGGTQVNTKGDIYNDGSGLFFTGTNHSHTGVANVEGHAAIENAVNYNHLMILGRWVSGRRYIAAWDQFTVNGTFLNNSDARAKQDIEDLPYGLNEVRQLHPVSFNWKTISNPQKSLGLIAQEVQTVISELVYESPDHTEEARLSLASLSLIPVLINAIKELDAQVQRLTSEHSVG